MSYDYRDMNKLFIAAEEMIKRFIETTPQEPRTIEAPGWSVFQEVADYLHNISDDMKPKKGRRLK
jgi:hypothetical protein